MSSAQQITRKAKSNLAFALSCLPKQRKSDMVIFYAFCRVIDDLADDLDIPYNERALGLTQWREGIENGFDHPDELQSDVMQIIERYSIPKQPFLDLIDGFNSPISSEILRKTYARVTAFIYLKMTSLGFNTARRN